MAVLEWDCGFASYYTDLSTTQQIKDIISLKPILWKLCDDAKLRHWIPNLQLHQQRLTARYAAPVFKIVYFFCMLCVLIFLILSICVLKSDAPSLPSCVLWMASRSRCGTNTPWWTPAGPSASQGSTVIIFILLISQIEMDMSDKNVTATPHVSGLTGLHVTF